MIQISTKSKCLLIRLNKMKKIPIRLKEFLENKEIIKTGVGIFNDILMIFNEYKIITKGVVDLPYIYNKFERDIKRDVGLKWMAKEMLDVEMCKEEIVRHSDWNSYRLSADQMHYAALDAYIGFKLLEFCYNKYKQENTKISQFCSESVEFIDKSYINHQKRKQRKEELFTQQIEQNSLKIENNDENKNVKKNKKIHKTNSQYLSVATSHIVEDVKMLSQEGKLLSYINNKKARFYCKNNLAIQLPNDPKSIQLLFQPKGEGVLTKNPYFLEGKIEE